MPTSPANPSPAGVHTAPPVVARALRGYRRLYRSWLAAKQRLVPTERQRLFGITIAIGGVCGLAAVAFHLAIEAVAAQTIERAMAVTGYAWIPWTIITPTLGGLISG